MTEDDLQQIIQLYKSDPAAEYEATWRIFTAMYCCNPFYIQTFYINGDIKHDFLVSFYPHIKHFLDKYDETKGKALPYFRYFTNGYFKNFYRSYLTSQKKQQVLQYNLKSYPFAAESPSYSTEELSDAADVDSGYRGIRQPQKYSKHEQRRFKITVLILALKSCREILPEMTQRIAAYTGMPPAELEHMLNRARDSLRVRETRRKKLTEIANNYYAEKLFLQSSNKNAEKTKCQEKNTAHTTAIRRKIQTITLAPSNRTVAEILGITAETVNRYIKFCKSPESTGFFELLRDSISV